MTMNDPVKVLIINDNPVVRLSLGRLLASDGMEITEAISGQEGLRLAKSILPELVLVDALLPDMKGTEVVRGLRAEPQCAGFLLVLSSCEPPGAEGEEEAFEAGADWCVSAGTGNRELRARLRAMLRLRLGEEALRSAQQELDLQVQKRTAALISANAALRSLSQRLVEVQESERRALARELHDEIGQALTGLKLSLRMASRAAPACEQPLQEPMRIIEDLMGRVRRLSLDLRPQLLDDLGLVVALEWHFERYFRQTGLRVRFENPGFTARLPVHLETAIFRVVQEALTNTAKHGGATEVRVRLWQSNGSIGVEVKDNGRGFDPETAEVARTSGVSGMQERAELLGGKFSLEAARGKGARIRVALPLEEPHQKA
jgi:signal transduction histidine kinase